MIEIIAPPNSPIEKLAVEFQKSLHLPYPDPLYVLMGAAAANMIEGQPVWIMLVGPPSCGKTELLNTLLGLDHMVEAADIASEAAFLSGTPARDKARDSTGGLLKQIGSHGGLVINDFTSVLSKPKDKLAAIMAVLREAYGGRWTRHIGGDGGRLISWQGKLALFAGCTSRIDKEHTVSQELGERWIYYRYEWRDTFAELSKALDRNQGGWQDALRAAVSEFFCSLGLSFGVFKPRREISPQEKLRLHRLASVAVACRSGVPRDPYNKEILGVKEPELAVRMAIVLSQLFLGMEAIGVPADKGWKLLDRVAMDSMPVLRKRIIDTAARFPGTVEDMQMDLLCDINVVKRTVEDLKVHGVVAYQDQKVVLTEWMKSNYLERHK